MNEKEKVKNYDELVALLKEIFPGNGNVNFDGAVIDKIVKIINPIDDWRYKNG